MALLAFALAEYIGLPAVSLLVKQARADQRGLSRAQRVGNMSEVFSVREPQWRTPKAAAFPTLRLERLILIDDVFTTGATLDAAARALLRSKTLGTQEIRVATVGRVW
jgi:predicted amidophosphoribosyltransferase